MFTGIITDIGTVRAAQPTGGGAGRRLEISTAFDTRTIAIGASLACSGACMTVVETGDDHFAVDVSAESLSKTTLGEWQAGTRVNLERALRVGDELGGHLVAGHVDGIAEVVSVEPAGESRRLVIRAGGGLAPFIAPQGSVTVDGVSLTVNTLEDGPDSVVFALNIIPHTQATTTLGKLTPGAKVNVEIDLLARYVARLQSR